MSSAAVRHTWLLFHNPGVWHRRASSGCKDTARGHYEPRVLYNKLKWLDYSREMLFLFIWHGGNTRRIRLVFAAEGKRYKSQLFECIISSCPAGSFEHISRVFLQDFLIMFIHHLATISLISFSYVNNMLRVGSLVMCVHDSSDFLLEVRTNARGSTLFWIIFIKQHCYIFRILY